MKICLDAGHYGKYNQSPANKAYFESEMTWKLHLLQKKYLEQYGVEVVTTRTNQATDKEVYARGAASKGCNLFISNHSNAVGTGVNETVDYPVVFVPISGNGNAIGEKLAACVTSVMGTKQKGRIATREGSGGDYYGVIRGAVAVGVCGVLIEHSFHTQTAATNWLLSDANLDKLAKAEVEVIAEHYNLTASTSKPTTQGMAIMGAAIATAEQMAAYLTGKNPTTKDFAAEYAALFLAEGANEGVRGDIAFAQSCLETGNFKFGGDVKPEQNNFAGIGATGGGNQGNSFKTPQEGIRAQIQHLKAYGSTAALKSPCVDPRFKYVVRGSAEFVEWLGIQENPNKRGWAAGADYGGKILNILGAILDTKPPKEEYPDVSEWARDAWKWAVENGVCDGLRPKDGATREEIITMLYRLNK